MSKVLVTESYLTDIGDAIRNKNGNTTRYTPSQMAQAIRNIKSTITYTTGDLKVVSPDSWSLNIMQTAHQTINANLKSELVRNSDGTYSTAINADFSISPDTGYVPGTVQRGADKPSKTYNLTASPAEEIAGMIEDGYAKVYQKGGSFYSDEDYKNKLTSLSGNILVVGMASPDISNTNFQMTLLFGNSGLTKFKNTFITSAGESLLNDCQNLTSVDLPNLTSAGKFLIGSCHNLESVNLPNLTSAGEYLLNNCSSLKSVSLPSLTHAASFFLEGCTSLESVDLPSLTSARDGFLYSCPNLKSIFLRSSIMCTRSTNYELSSGLSIYVPASLIDSYKTATDWSSCKDKFKTLESIRLSKISIEGKNTINTYNGNTTAKYSVKYNDGDVLPEQSGATWSITGNATISQDGTVTLNNASVGDTLTITVTSTYNSSISASLTVTVVNKPIIISINLNNGQWVDSGTTVDGHTVYKSDAGSYHVDNGQSVCTVTVEGYNKVTVYVRSYAENSYDYVEVGPLDGAATRDSSLNVLSTEGRQSATKYYSHTFTIPDNNQHTFQVLYSKDGSRNANDDRGYFYLVTE